MYFNVFSVSDYTADAVHLNLTDKSVVCITGGRY